LVAGLPLRHAPVAALGAADRAGADLSGRRDGRFFLPEHGLFREGHIAADLRHRYIVDPEMARGHQAEGGARLLLLADVRDVRELRPAEGAVLAELHVLPVEHELGHRVPGARPDVEPPDVPRDLVPSRLDIHQLGHADLRSRAAGEEAGVLPRAGHPADAKVAIALVLPAAPPGEDQAEAVLVLGDLEGGVLDQVLAARRGLEWKDGEKRGKQRPGRCMHGFLLG
jgi:hypothetical protein